MIKNYIYSKFLSLSGEAKISFIGIAVTFFLSSYSLFLQYSDSVELNGIVKFHGSTEFSENVQYRLSVINSGNTPVSVHRVHFSISNTNGETLNSKVDVIEPFSLKPGSIEILKLNQHLISTGLKGLHQIAISFEVVDINANVYTNKFTLGQIDIGGDFVDGNFRLPSFKIDLISGNTELLN